MSWILPLEPHWTGPAITCTKKYLGTRTDRWFSFQSSMWFCHGATVFLAEFWLWFAASTSKRPLRVRSANCFRAKLASASLTNFINFKHVFSLVPLPARSEAGVVDPPKVYSFCFFETLPHQRAKLHDVSRLHAAGSIPIVGRCVRRVGKTKLMMLKGALQSTTFTFGAPNRNV